MHLVQSTGSDQSRSPGQAAIVLSFFVCHMLSPSRTGGPARLRVDEGGLVQSHILLWVYEGEHVCQVRKDHIGQSPGPIHNGLSPSYYKPI